MPCYSPLKGYKARSNGGFTFRKDESLGEKMTVPCMGCLGCRLDHSAAWAARIVHESESHLDNSFVTLTYDEETMPRLWAPDGPGTLKPKDVQDFIKRLRWDLGEQQIKYFQCGEYGDNLHRPHYHLCILGWRPDDLELFSDREGIHLHTSEYLQNKWQHGFSTVGELNYETAAYTARYILKKVTGDRSHYHYMRHRDDGALFHLEPEFIRMSKGLGADWYERFNTDLWPSDEVPVPGKGNFKKVPRFYANLLEKQDPELYDAVKRNRKLFRQQHKEDYEPDKLYNRYKTKKAQIQTLKRTLE